LANSVNVKYLSVQFVVFAMKMLIS